jgi:hypothetical protein
MCCTWYVVGETCGTVWCTKCLLGHSAKNDRSTELLRGFCTRETFLWGVPYVHADIVANPDFERAVVKIQVKQFAAMTDTENEAAAPPKTHTTALPPSPSPSCFTRNWSPLFPRKTGQETYDRRTGSLRWVHELWFHPWFLVLRLRLNDFGVLQGRSFLRTVPTCIPSSQVEALLFLRSINKWFWDKREVVEAISRQNKKHLQNTRNGLWLVVTWTVNFKISS